MRIAILVDTAVKAMPEYNAGDVERTLKEAGYSPLRLPLAGLACLERADLDVLIVPFVDGEIPEQILSSLVGFHEHGGSLLFLGDLPFHGRWYPQRNSHAARFHLTRCHDSFTPTDESGSFLTPDGAGIVGELPGPAFLRGKSFPCLRVTPFPADRCLPLFHEARDEWAPWSHAVVAVDRRGPRFLGARLAVVGFNGGEPRENADGAYHKIWRHDPGILDRDWLGIHALVRGLVAWLSPKAFAGAIQLRALRGEAEHAPVSFLLHNLTLSPLSLDEVTLSCDGEPLVRREGIQLSPGGTEEVPAVWQDLKPGPHRFTLSAIRAGASRLLDERQQGILPNHASAHRGFGFSTYWSFQSPRVSPEYPVFCSEMASRGCQYVRANIPWEDVEPEPGRYVWDVPDQLLDAGAQAQIALQFWMFPTTRGSGLSDGGVPWWILKEPAVDRNGDPGFFPSLWSPFYRERYFALVDAFTRRYAGAERLSQFVLDFGNSDFPYGYAFYYNDASLYDYSPWERDAYSRYLREERGLPLDEASELFGGRFDTWADVPVPLPEQAAAWREYLAFRVWSIRIGIEEVYRICKANAPSKVPADLPGHGLGSISDLHAAALDAKARHWEEERGFDPCLTTLHNAGPTWGGEPWQVAGRYRQYDPHLFSSVRYNASYFTIPGPDLGVDGEDITRVGLIRRTLMGASRPTPRVAVLDDLHARESLCQVAVRLDQEVDLITSRHRYDFSCYTLLVLPPRDRPPRTETGGGAGHILPIDEDWYRLLASSLRRGLHLLIYPRTGDVDGRRHPHLHRILGLEDVRYGPRRHMSVAFPTAFGSGVAHGMAVEVRTPGEPLLVNDRGEPILVRLPLGLGEILLAGFDAEADSLDGHVDPWRHECLGAHTLPRLCLYLGCGPAELQSGQVNIRKSLLRRGDDEYLVLFNDRACDTRIQLIIRPRGPAAACRDLVSGVVLPLANGGTELECMVRGGEGRYFALQKGAT